VVALELRGVTCGISSKISSCPVPEYLRTWVLPDEWTDDKEILRRELGLEILAALGAHFLSPAQKVARVEVLTKILQILHQSEENHFKGIAICDESLVQYSNCPIPISIPIRPQNVCTTVYSYHSKDAAGHRDETD
jgi:hypothetical protein